MAGDYGTLQGEVAGMTSILPRIEKARRQGRAVGGERFYCRFFS